MPENNTNNNWLDSKIGKFFLNLLNTAIITLIFTVFAYFYAYYNVIPIIYNTKSTVDSLKIDIDKIKNCYVTKDKEGIEIKVGINSELEGNTVSVYKGNKYNFKFSDPIFLTNLIDKNHFFPTIQLLISKEIERNNDKSEAVIFISKEAASRLGLTKSISLGIFTLKMKMKERELE